MSNAQTGAAPLPSPDPGGLPDGRSARILVHQLGGVVILEVEGVGGVGFDPAIAHQLGASLIAAAGMAAHQLGANLIAAAGMAAS